MSAAQKLSKDSGGATAGFPPEAYEMMPEVKLSDIAEWRKKLEERFGIGQGKLKPIDEPQQKQ